MSGEEFKRNDFEERIREYVLVYLRDKKLIQHNDNIIHSEKVFIINAVLRWCLQRIRTKRMSADLWAKNKKILAQYIAGTVNIVWAENSFKVIEVQVEKPKVTRTKRKPRGNNKKN